MTKSKWVATDFIANHTKPSGYTAGDIVEFIGWSGSGDGGAAQWKATGNSITPSQTPADLGDAKLSDASGNEFELVVSGCSVSLESVGYGITLDGTNQLRIAIDYCINNNITNITSLRDDVTITDEVILDRSERINLNMLFRVVCSGANSKILIGSSANQLINSNIFIKEIVGDIANKPYACLQIAAMRYSSLRVGGLSRSSYGLLIRPDGGAVATSKISIGWVVNNTEGVRLWDEAAYLAGGNSNWHTQGLMIDIGFCSFNDYGLRKKKESIIAGEGAPLDLVTVTGSFDENNISDILDEMPDSRSWYQLLFHDNEDVYTTTSLDGIGIDTSVVIKHYRGAGANDDNNMSITLGNEDSGLISGALKSKKDADKDGVIVECRTEGVGDDAVLSYYHAGVRTASINSRLVSSDSAILPVRILDGGVFVEKFTINGASITPTAGVNYQLGTAIQPFFRFVASDGYYVNGNKVLGTQQPAISDSVGGDEQAKINSILAALRAHGIIAT